MKHRLPVVGLLVRLRVFVRVVDSLYRKIVPFHVAS